MPHIHEKIDFVVEVFIVHKNKVLLRKHDKYRIWLSVGGHVELDEDPNEAALREVREEVGLDIILFGNPHPSFREDKDCRSLIPPKYLERHVVGSTNHEHVCMIYFGKASSDKVTPEKETDVWGWFTKEDLDTRKDLNLKESIVFYAKNALDELTS